MLVDVDCYDFKDAKRSYGSFARGFFYLRSRTQTSILFPYTTLFRSGVARIPSDVLAALDVTTRGLAARSPGASGGTPDRSEEHTSELQSRENLVCRLLLEKKNWASPLR